MQLQQHLEVLLGNIQNKMLIITFFGHNNEGLIIPISICDQKMLLLK